MATNPIPKRIAADINEIQSDEYAKQGIHYWFDDANMTEGKLLIWGPKDSPYEDMPMLYKVNFPVPGYPFENPKILFLTNDEHNTRFHPNMYQSEWNRAGIVCLSILGTWDGPRWAATMRLSTAAITIQSLMDNNPIAHEPGFANSKDPKILQYSEYIRFRCTQFIMSLLWEYTNKQKVPHWLANFEEEFIGHLPGLLDRLEARLEKVKEETTWVNVPYSMKGKSNYGEMRKKLVVIKQKLAS